MARRLVALSLLLIIGLSSVEILLPGEVDAVPPPAGRSIVGATDAATHGGGRVDGACLCACGCTHAQVAVVADLILPIGPYLTHTEYLSLLAPRLPSVDPVLLFKPPRA
jgi:hypothetical protein